MNFSLKNKPGFLLRDKLLIAIFILAVFLRFYKLSEFPVHLGHDEVSQLYDAISIDQTGKDIYGKPYPFIFQSVNDYKPPFYTYATSFSYLIFGWQDITVRIPGAISGSLIVLAVYFFVNQFLKNRFVVLLAVFITAISPFEVFFSRKSFENQTGILLVLIGFTLLGKYLVKKKKSYFYWSAVVFGLATYIYTAQAVLIPILLIIFFVLYWKKFKPFKLLPIAAFLIIVTPLYYMMLFNPQARDRSSNVFITQDARLSGADDRQILKYAAMRYVDQFDPKYLFLNGLDMTEGKRDVGPIFPVLSPFILIGAYLLLKAKDKNTSLFLFSMVLVGMIPSGLTFEDHSPHRAVIVFTILNVIAAIGINSVYKKYGGITLLIVFLLLAANFAFFTKRYLINYPIERSESLHYPYKEVAIYAWENYQSYDKIIFDPKFGEFAPWIGTGAHYYLAYYGKYPPEKMQSEFEIGDQKVRETKFDKFSIRAVFWPEDHSLKDTLIIASPWSLPPDIKERANIVKIFYFRTTAEAFYAIKL